LNSQYRPPDNPKRPHVVAFADSHQPSPLYSRLSKRAQALAVLRVRLVTFTPKDRSTLFMSAPKVRLPLLNRAPITYSSAAQHEDNIINKLKSYEETKQLVAYLQGEKQSIETLVAHHLGLSSKDKCVMLDLKQWLRGSFNISIPIEVIRPNGVTSKVIMRCPMPHKLAETRYPGTVREKLRCEVGSYILFQEHLSRIPIAHLFGFGFPDGQHVSVLSIFFFKFISLTHSVYSCNPTTHLCSPCAYRLALPVYSLSKRILLSIRTTSGSTGSTHGIHATGLH